MAAMTGIGIRMAARLPASANHRQIGGRDDRVETAAETAESSQCAIVDRGRRAARRKQGLQELFERDISRLRLDRLHEAMPHMRIQYSVLTSSVYL